MQEQEVSKVRHFPGQLVSRSITNTKQAAVLVTVGIELEDKGIYLDIDKTHPNSTGGRTHFHFKTQYGEKIANLLAIYDADNAQETFNQIIIAFKSSDDPKVRATAEIIDRAWDEAIICWGRRFLENYTRIVAFLKSTENKVIITGGESARDNDGSVIGKQMFEVHFPSKRNEPSWKQSKY